MRALEIGFNDDLNTLIVKSATVEEDYVSARGEEVVDVATDMLLRILYVIGREPDVVALIYEAAIAASEKHGYSAAREAATMEHAAGHA